MYGKTAVVIDFNPRSPCGERPEVVVFVQHVVAISIHAPRVGSDIRRKTSVTATPLFQSTLPVWGATLCFKHFFEFFFISIHAPRVGSDPFTQQLLNKIVRSISIHAPRVGSDIKPRLFFVAKKLFQSTLPVWGATLAVPVFADTSPFQSTLPVWGATRSVFRRLQARWISIHAPRVGSDFAEKTWDYAVRISIHAPRVGSDQPLTSYNRATDEFQSTLPVWGATLTTIIRAPPLNNFNPRSPCGERQKRVFYRPCDRHFNPRSPCGERRKKMVDSITEVWISIHAPRVGSDLYPTESVLIDDNFNPRSPCGERHTIFSICQYLFYFNPRSPCGERLHNYFVFMRFLFCNIIVFIISEASFLICATVFAGFCIVLAKFCGANSLAKRPPLMLRTKL